MPIAAYNLQGFEYRETENDNFPVGIPMGIP